MEDFEFLAVRTEDFITTVQLHHRERGNTLNLQMWSEIHDAFTYISHDPKTRVVILTGDGEHFCSGIDMNDYKDFICGEEMPKKEKKNAKEDEDHKKFSTARQSLALRQRIECCQKSFTAIEKCPKPVIAAILGQCIGGGMGIITACDIRIATQNAVFALKEIDIAMISDHGPLNRLPKLCKHSSWLRDVAFTGRKFDASEALKHCVISTVYDSEKGLLKAAHKMAEVIAEKSPVAMQSSKLILNFARDHKRTEVEKYGNAIRMLSIQSEDLKESLKGVEDSEGRVGFDDY